MALEAYSDRFWIQEATLVSTFDHSADGNSQVSRLDQTSQACQRMEFLTDKQFLVCLPAYRVKG